MAKNRDRRKDPKPKPPKGETPLLRKARPDLLPRVATRVRDGLSTTAEKLARELREHAEDVSDCLAALIREGRVIKDGSGFRQAPDPLPPPPKKLEKLDPAVLLKVRRVFERVETAAETDFKGVDDIKRHLDRLLQDRLIAKVGEKYVLREHPTVPGRASYRQPRASHGSGVCPWCKKPSRRHARSEVHDSEQCRLDMIKDIMGE